MTTTPGLVFVTGATSGIGEATARAFAAAGSDLLLMGRRQDRLHALKKELDGVQVTPWVADVREAAGLAAGAAAHKDLLARVDVVVNNAGLAIGRVPFQDSRPDEWDAMIDTNLKGLLRTTQLVLPHMVKRGSGHVVNIGSITGRRVYRGAHVYAATKFAVRGFSESLRLDLLGTGVRVTVIDPGQVRTEFSLVRFGGDTEKAGKVYQGFRSLEPADIADAVVWAATRPPHVDVAEMLVMPTDQAGTDFHRA